MLAHTEMKTASIKDRVQAATVLLLAVAAFSHVGFASWRALHEQPADGDPILFFVGPFLCCVPLWLLAHWRFIRQDAATHLAGVAAGAVALSLLFLPEHFGYDLFRPVWNSLAGFGAGVALYGFWISLFRSVVGWFFRACRDSLSLFFPGPSHHNRVA